MKHDKGKKKRHRRRPSPTPREGAGEYYRAEGGRPRGATLYTPELHQRLCESLEAGAPLGASCRAAGISDDTYQVWRRRAEEGEEPYRQLIDDAVQAKAAGLVAAYRTLYGARHLDWRAAKARIDLDPENPRHVTNGGGAAQVSADDLAQAFARLQQAVELSVPMEPNEETEPAV